MKTNTLYIFIISRSILLRMRNVSDESFREIQNTFYVRTLFFNRAVYEMPGTQATEDNITPRMRIAYWIPKATNTHTQNT
jgi:hypothetical protein